jgi:hypothetical protein
MSENDFFMVQIFVVDTKINPTDNKPISKVLEKKIFVSFTNTMGSLAVVNLARYEVVTDVSLLPYTQEETE